MERAPSASQICPENFGIKEGESRELNTRSWVCHSLGTEQLPGRKKQEQGEHQPSPICWVRHRGGTSPKTKKSRRAGTPVHPPEGPAPSSGGFASKKLPDKPLILGMLARGLQPAPGGEGERHNFSCYFKGGEVVPAGEDPLSSSGIFTP